MTQNYENMRYMLLLVSLFIGSGAIHLSAQEEKDYLSDTVRVEKSRLHQEVAAPGSLHKHTVHLMPQRTGEQISEILPYITGVFVRDYGGIGGLKNVSLRGMASTQTLVLLDGVRLNQAQNGLSDMGRIPASFVEEVEVRTGGSTAWLGSGGIGGNVSLSLKQPADTFSIGLHSGIGSFGEWSGGANASLPVGEKAGVLLSVSGLRAEGRYPFPFEQFGNTEVLQRENADIHQFSAAGRIVWQPNLVTTLEATTLAGTAERGIPGAVVQGSIEMTDARLQENDVLQILKCKTAIDENFAFEGIFSGRWNQWQFRDSISPLAITENEFSTLEANSLLHITYLGGSAAHSLIVEGGYQRLDGNFLQPDIDGVAVRKSLGIGYLVEGVLSAPILREISYAISLRHDRASDAGSGNSFSASLARDLDIAGLSLHAGIARNVRFPSFNEMYYLNFGNADLSPERSLSLNTGIKHTNTLFSLRLDGYMMNAADLIVALPISPVAWSAQNLGNVVGRGIEVTAALALDSPWQAHWAYSYRLTTDEDPASPFRGKEVVYSPRETAAFFCSYQYLWWKAGGDVQYSSYRYALPSNDISSIVEGYYAVSLFCEISTEVFRHRSTLRFQVDNITNQTFAVIRNFPMPGRQFRLRYSALW